MTTDHWPLATGHWPLILSASDEIHDLDLVALSNDGALERPAFEDDKVDLDGYATRVDLQVVEKLRNRYGLRQLVRLSVQSNPHSVQRNPARRTLHAARGSRSFERSFDCRWAHHVP